MAAGVADGALIVDTGIDNSGFFRDKRQFDRAVEGMKNSATAMGRQMAQGANGYAQAMRRAKAETQGAEAQIKKLEAEAAKLQKAMTGEKIYSDSYRELTAQIAEAEQQIERLQAKQQEWAEMGISPDSAPFQEVDAQIFELMDNIDALIAKQEELKASGGAYTSDYLTAQGRYQALQTQIEQLQEMAAAAEETADAERDIAQNAKEAGTAVSSMGHSFKNVLKYGLGIRSLFVLFNRLRGAVKEGFKELEQYSPAVRGALGKLKASLAGLKGSLAGAFAPILTSVAPALTKLIDLLTKGFNALSAFFAALMGQTSYYVASGIENVGEAASDAGDEVRDLNRQLASFDELNILSKKSSGGGGGGSGGGTEATVTFEERPLDGWLLKLSEFIRGLKQKLEDFTAGWPDWLKWLFGGVALIGGFLLIKNLVSWLLKKFKDLFSFDLPDWLKWLFRGKDDGTGGDRDIKINLKKGDWSLLKELDDLEYPVKLIPEFSKKAGDLYKSFKEEWEKVARPLLFTPGTTMTAGELYSSFKTAWDRMTRSLTFTPGTTMTAGELYNSFKTAWDRVTRSLTFTPGTTMTAGELYSSFKTAWDRMTRSLTFTPGTTMTAGELYNSFKTAWDRVTRSLTFTPGMSMTAGELYKDFKAAWDRAKREIDVYVKLVKSGWKTLAAYVGTYEPNVYVKLVKSGWKTLGTYVGTYTATIMVQLQKSGWTTLSQYLKDNFGGATGGGGQTTGGGAGRGRANSYSATSNGSSEDYTVGVALYLEENAVPTLAQSVRKYWNDLSKSDRAVPVNTTLQDSTASMWQTLMKWWKSQCKNWWNKLDVSPTLEDNTGSMWSDLKKWWESQGKNWWNELKIKPTLENNTGSLWDQLKKWWDQEGSYWWHNLTATVNVSTAASGGYVKSFASGGVVRGGVASWWDAATKYASGTSKAHGTVFVAGEAGPEVVGHVNGRTEILNRSQLAEAMYGAVVAGMGAAVNALGAFLAERIASGANAIVSTIGAGVGLIAGDLNYRVPAMASGSVLPYDVAAQIARTGEGIEHTLNANNEDLIQTMISIIGAQTNAIVSALARLEGMGGNGGGVNAQQVINLINQRTQMFGASPLQGV